MLTILWMNSYNVTVYLLCPLLSHLIITLIISFIYCTLVLKTTKDERIYWLRSLNAIGRPRSPLSPSLAPTPTLFTWKRYARYWKHEAPYRLNRSTRQQNNAECPTTLQDAIVLNQSALDCLLIIQQNGWLTVYWCKKTFRYEAMQHSLSSLWSVKNCFHTGSAAGRMQISLHRDCPRTAVHLGVKQTCRHHALLSSCVVHDLYTRRECSTTKQLIRLVWVDFSLFIQYWTDSKSTVKCNDWNVSHNSPTHPARPCD